ncbi:UDP-forming cellulose synthase catalytic subunit [Burkholderia glumae]|uniref:UDP-forming cellulose synthase catalytic subunit n=1 Tax=Burkholderia glumae TaxID=337 RepID=UPI000C272F4C|nr:UDP-forming cellulose synthase catalytic subunit [Burkholderia glumae]MCQ0033190.1 UDP-forming cellulose synthase catalytic subunit [Burkholderia glumae]MCQ0040381.1 UDP-forming cellulose synthase catalytic subunit [Burkholderia glumae]PJO20971.1 UDP-forming cellulose synthase catalytic subunit [Burkholderia glumae AU6208]QHE13921.1 UDP-forming cellulose synthase catalytic subunit [Burkholderia glumae AU6208]QJW81400.1 UDP-forming cellulose synthase catalytic subunit [Burkholderia glumae]
MKAARAPRDGQAGPVQQGGAAAATRLQRFVDAPFWGRLPIVLPLALLAAVTLFFVWTVPLTNPQQLAFATCCFVAALLFRRIEGHYVTLVMIMLSVITTGRYMVWRLSDTTYWSRPLDMIWGVLLVAAEIYAALILLLGYFQTAWPLKRKPVPMPASRADWPTVDVFIPTYNEPLSVVKPTVYAALALDYPPDKLTIHVLDDGRRADFKAFCEEVGVNWTIRAHNRYAKAGNINEALKITHGEFFAVFDCDHIPTRSFLQLTLGWFLRDRQLSLLQTPHHFFSADPFERNLGTFRKVPNENELFYGLVQDGNDLWNAAFFCGSCAVLRRSMVEEIGGIAVETVTEDAHTSLKLHRLGYTTAYLAIPQAAGLATESLSGHIGQRIRWARGMTQIFRIDNPLVGRGLTIAQRLCYLNGMLHFFYGIPRLVFLTAPLSFLFFGAQVIQASAVTIALFALPHMLHANATNSRMQRQFRHSFWAEVYESVLASYITPPTLLALINPKLGKFNVTAKGGMIEQKYFDWAVSRPYLILLVLNLLGFVIGVWHIHTHWAVKSEVYTLVLNIGWTAYNMLILGASVAAATEQKQVRAVPRVAMTMPVMLRFGTGRTLACETIDYSEGGVGVALPQKISVPLHERITVSLFRGDEEYAFRAVVASSTPGRAGLQFVEMTKDQEFNFVKTTFARADAWTGWAEGRKPDAPLRALGTVLSAGARGIFNLFEHLYADARAWGKRAGR